jgi:hypothetical protein
VRAPAGVRANGTRPAATVAAAAGRFWKAVAIASAMTCVTREIYKWKARLNIGGHMQQYGVHYWETYHHGDHITKSGKQSNIFGLCRAESEDGLQPGSPDERTARYVRT